MTAVGAAELLFHLGLAGAFLALLSSTLELWRGAPQLDAPRARGLLPQVRVRVRVRVRFRVRVRVRVRVGVGVKGEGEG